MITDESGIAIVFDVPSLGKEYPLRAWEVFMRHADPARLAGVTLRDGDTDETLRGEADQFCIAVVGSPGAIEHVRATFGGLELPELSAEGRIMEGEQLRNQPLPVRARIDEDGALVTEAWEEGLHRLCVACEWAYRPREVPNLEPGLREEVDRLGKMDAKRPAPIEAQVGRGATAAQKEHAGKKWWRFWGR